MRLPLAVPLISRDGTLAKDPLVTNGIIEGDKKSSVVRSRPGLIDLGLIAAGTGRLLACWNGLLSVVGSSLSSLLLSTGGSSTSNFYNDIPSWGFTEQAGYLYYLQAGSVYRAQSLADTPTLQGSTTTLVDLLYSVGSTLYALDYDATQTGYRSADNGASWVSEGTNSPQHDCLFSDGSNLYTASIILDLDIDDEVVGYTLTLQQRNANGSTSSTVASFTVVDAATLVTEGEALVVKVGTVYYVLFRGYSGARTGNADYDLYMSSFNGSTWSHYTVASLTDKNWPVSGNTTGCVVSGVLYLPMLVKTANGYYNVVPHSFNLTTRSLTALSASVAEWVTVGAGNAYFYFAGNANKTWVGVVDNSSNTELIEYATTGANSVITTAIGTLADVLLSVESTGAAQSQQELLFKSSQQLWQYTEAGGLVLVTDIDYPGHHTYTASSVTRSGSTATFNTTVTNALEVGQVVTVAGASQTEYNGSHEILSIVDGDTFTYAVTGTPATPATGTITVYGGKTTVPGLVFLDGYFFVMTDKGVIFNSALGDGTSWNALDFVTAAEEPGAGVALGKIGNYLVAFKEWSTEPFYDAGNATGSPISPVRSASTLIGCASGESLASFDGRLVWISQTKDKGRSVHTMTGLQQLTQIATPDVERVLAADDLARVSAYGIRIAGHVLYILTLHTSAITLVYDFTAGVWARWTSLTADTPLSVTSMVRNGTTVTVVTSTAHGRSDGDPVLFAGADQSDYNGRFNVQVISSTSLSFEVSSSQDTTATGTITATTYTEGHFALTKHVYCTGRHLLLHESNGHLYEILDSETSDALAPIDLRCRTGKVDGNRASQKQLSQLEVIGHKTTDGLALVRWTDDDYASWSAYRQVDLGAERSRLRRCGNFSRRAFELRYTGDAKVTLGALELGEKG